MTPLYPYWQALYMSLYSKALYLDVGRGRRGLGLGYLTLLSALLSAIVIGYIMMLAANFHVQLPPAVQTEQEGKPDINQIISQAIAQVPVITIKDGNASITEPQPYTIVNPDNKKPIAIIDTTGTYTSLDNTEAVILLTQTKLIYRKNRHSMESYFLKELSKGDRVVDATTVAGWAMYFKKIVLWTLALFIFPLVTLISFIYLAIRACIFGGIGMIIGSTLSINDLYYKDYVRLAAVASTPIAFLHFLLMMLSVGGSSLTLSVLIFALGVGYMYVAVKANRWL